MFFNFTNDCIYKFNLFNSNNFFIYWYNNNFFISNIILLFKFNLVYNNFRINFDILNYINIIELLAGRKPFLKKLNQKKFNKKIKKIYPIFFYFFLKINKIIFFNLYKHIICLIELYNLFLLKFNNNFKKSSCIVIKNKKKLFVQKIILKHIFILLNFFNFKYNENYCLKHINLYIYIYTFNNNYYFKKFMKNVKTILA